ncbi:hypothetical protein [Streptomyces prasinopilosus]|uniref:hypothetical protein n=1 Tax=Streptomyces prasinopilosus TaxID=67344 RepID=UPI00099F35A5|nr:hypothetical protein [Streptomyces prasinopilosus]
MPERDSILRVTGAAVLTLVAAACTAGLAGVLRRDRRGVREDGTGLRIRMRTPARAGTGRGPGGPKRRDEDIGPRPDGKPDRNREPDPRPHPEPQQERGVPAPREVRALRTIPRQRRTGPEAESVRLTPAEREAFAVLVRRFAGGREK